VCSVWRRTRTMTIEAVVRYCLYVSCLAAPDACEAEDRAQISSPSSTGSLSSDVNQHQQEGAGGAGEEEGVAAEGEEWEQVGPKNKSTIVRQVRGSGDKLSRLIQINSQAPILLK